jgi:hypothetical protein
MERIFSYHYVNSRRNVGGGVNPRKYGAEKANLQVVSAEMPRSQPCHSVSPLRYVKGALRQAA